MNWSVISDKEIVNYQCCVLHRAWSKPIRDLPSFHSCTHQAPHAGSCERLHLPHEGTCRGRAGHAGRPLKPRTSARECVFQKVLLSSSWGAIPCSLWSASSFSWCSRTVSRSWHTCHTRGRSKPWHGRNWCESNHMSESSVWSTWLIRCSISGTRKTL